MNKILVTLFTTLIVSIAATSQEYKPGKDLQELFTQRGEVRFSFLIQDKSEIEKLTHIISIDNIEGNMVTAYASEKEFGRFLELGYPYDILPELSEGFDPLMVDEVELSETTVWNF